MGRPSKGVSEKYIGVRLPEEFYKFLQKEAEETDRPLAEVVRDMMSVFIAPEFYVTAHIPEGEELNYLDQLKRMEESLEEAMQSGKSNLLEAQQRLDMVRASIKKVEEVAERERKKVLE